MTRRSRRKRQNKRGQNPNFEANNGPSAVEVTRSADNSNLTSDVGATSRVADRRNRASRKSRNRMRANHDLEASLNRSAGPDDEHVEEDEEGPYASSRIIPDRHNRVSQKSRRNKENNDDIEMPADGYPEVAEDGDEDESASSVSTDQRPGAFREGGNEDESQANYTMTASTYVGPMTTQTDPNISTPLDADVVPDLEETIQERMQQRTVNALDVQASTSEGHEVKAEVRSMTRQAFFFIVLGMLFLGISFGVIISSQANSTMASVTKETEAPTAASTISDFDYAVDLFTGLSAVDLLLNVTTPHHQALSWLVFNDKTSHPEYSIQTESSWLLKERFTAALLYFATDGSSWYNNLNFLSEDSVCDWHVGDHGIQCNELGRVRYIFLRKFLNRFRNIILLLRFLLTFRACPLLAVVVGNNLNGTIPSEIEALSSLESLSLGQDNLRGTLPESLGYLSNLRTFQILLTHVSGSIPDSYGQLNRLRTLWLPVNGLTGSIPRDIFAAPDLERVNLSSNRLNGSIPEFSENQALRFLGLTDNLLSGTIPESLYLPSLESIYLANNLLSGPLSSKIGNLQELTVFQADGNVLNGTLPTQLGQMTNVESLTLAFNGLTGSIPRELGLLTRLADLWLAYNYLTGTIPQEFEALNADTIWLQVNNLTGDLDMFCNQSDLSTQIRADCNGPDPLIECPCCSYCCDASLECEARYENMCRIEALSFEAPSGSRYVPDAGAVCECILGEGKNMTLSCSDRQCEMSCNQESTTCAINEGYSMEQFDEFGFWHTFRSTFRYVVGRNDTVTFETQYYANGDLICSVAINDQVCNSCGRKICPDGFFGYDVLCDNVAGAGYVSVCDEKLDYDDGVLAVLAFQDPLRHTGCPPRLYPQGYNV